MHIIKIVSIEKLLSINMPKKAVPKAVENTIKAVVKAFILPIYLTPYISAQVDDPKTLAKPLETPTKPKKINENTLSFKKYKNINPTNKGKLIIGKSFLLENLSTKKPDVIKVKIDVTE